jgi:hypothetical protein
MWSIIALITFLIVKSDSSNVTCYTNSSSDETASCVSYCQISNSTSDNFGSSQACSDPPQECDIFNAVNNCIYASITYDNVTITCDAVTNAPKVTSQTITETFKIECCNSNLCNKAFSSSCSSSSSLETYLSYGLTCAYDELSSFYNTYGGVFCGNYTSVYTTSSCVLETVDVKASQCECEADIYLYGLATTSADKAAIASTANFSQNDYNVSQYGCQIVATCTSSGFTYSITSYSYSFDLILKGYTNYSITEVIDSVYTTMSVALLISSPLQIYVSSASITSSSSGSSTITVVTQYDNMNSATISRTTVNADTLTFSVTSGITTYSATVSSVSSVQSNSYSISSGNMNTFIGISLLLAMIGLLIQ